MHISPNVSTNQEYIGAKNINYHGMNLNFHITDNAINIECTKNESVRWKLLRHKWSKEGVSYRDITLDEPYGYQADANGDGDVDGLDLQALIEGFTAGSATEIDIQTFALGFGI